MAVKDLLTKPPFYRLVNGGLEAASYNAPQPIDNMGYTERKLQGQMMTQADYLEEFYPFSHRIMSDFYFPEFYNYTEEVGSDGRAEQKYYREETFRIGSTLQSLTTVQQLVHLTGNDIHYELTSPLVNYQYNEQLRECLQGWLQCGMESVFYEFAKSVKMVADGAIVFYVADGKPGAKVLSFTSGDSIFMHYDSITGEPSVFARKFSSYDEEGEEVVSWVEVWDKEYFTRYKQSLKGLSGAVSTIKNFVGLDGYEMVGRPQKHGFSMCPVVYMRDKDNGPCWNMVQSLIDDYEVALSYFAKNNAAAALPSYKLKGDDIDIKGDMLGRVRAFTMGKEDDVSLIQPNGLSENYTKYIEYLLNEIFAGAFIVKHPELKSGDTPTGTMKLYYAPSLDKATLDAKEYHPHIMRMFKLFCEAYGMANGKYTEYVRLSERVFGWIIPYVHENTSSLIADLVLSKNAGILSTESVVEHHPYATNDEFDRITKEEKQQQQADRLYQLRTMTTQTETQTNTEVEE